MIFDRLLDKFWVIFKTILRDFGIASGIFNLSNDFGVIFEIIFEIILPSLLVDFGIISSNFWVIFKNDFWTIFE